jgi:putative transposase
MDRAFTWLGQFRRMSKDYDRLAETGETLVYVAVTRFMVRRLSRA